MIRQAVTASRGSLESGSKEKLRLVLCPRATSVRHLVRLRGEGVDGMRGCALHLRNQWDECVGNSRMTVDRIGRNQWVAVLSTMSGGSRRGRRGLSSSNG